MPSSRTAQKKKAVSKASNFKKNRSMDLELPSGNVCRVRRPGIEQLMAEGVFSDSLLPLIQGQIDAAKSGKKAKAPDLDMADLLKDPAKMAGIMDAYDKVAMKVVIEPKVAYHKVEVDGKWVEIDDDDRDDEIVYTDEIDMNDKIFIFQFVVGGTDDLAKFREQLGEGVADLPDGEAVELPTE